MEWLKEYGDTEGPLGFPMGDKEAKALDALIKTLPQKDYQRVIVKDSTRELAPGERADVSLISTESIDRDKEVVLCSGFRDEMFAKNPIVTINHDYKKNPVGRSIWRKRIREGALKGIKAKTVYPPRPDEWKESEWPPDAAYALIYAGLMTGKSVGFITIKAHQPTPQEIMVNPAMEGVKRIIDEWMLLEYSCTWMPVNPDTIVQAVSKSMITVDHLKAVGAEVPVQPEQPAPNPETPPPPQPPPDLIKEVITPHTSIEEIEVMIQRSFGNFDAKKYVENLWKEGLNKARGRI